MQGAKQVDAGDARPVFQRIIVQPGARDIEHQVQSAVFAHRAINQLTHLLSRRHIAAMRQRLAPGPANAGRHFARQCVVDIGHDHGGAQGGTAARDGRARA